MEKLKESKILYFSLLFLIAVFPFAITTYFYSANDLVKSSVIYIAGGIIIAYSSILIIINIIGSKNSSEAVYHAGSLDLFILIFLGAIVLSALFSINPGVSFRGTYERQVGLQTFLYLTALYFIFGAVFESPVRRKKIIFLTEAVAFVISVYAVFQFLQFDFLNLMSPSADKRPGSTIGYPVFLGGFLAIVFPFSVINAAEKQNPVLRILFPAALFSAIISTGTRSAYLALAVQFIAGVIIFRKSLLNYFNKNRRAIITGSVPAIILIYLFLFVFNKGMLFQRILWGMDIYNPRFYLWSDAINILYKYPMTGPGIAMFPAALEEFYSNALRFSDAKVTYDHAHNNFLQVLLTTGITGLIAYTGVLFISFKKTLNIIRDKTFTEKDNKIAAAVFIILAGYCAYGLTNFDDISIYFLFFIFLSILRSMTLKKYEINLRSYKVLSVTVLAAVVAFVLINIPAAVNNLAADRNFKLANVSFNEGKFSDGINYNNKAIILNPGCSAYRYYEAIQVYSYCFENASLNKHAEMSLLKQAEEEIAKIKNELYYINYCNGLLSLVYFEEGRLPEAGQLTREVLEKDSVNLNYRLRLAGYFIRENRLEEANRSLKILLLMKPKDITTLILGAAYYQKLNDVKAAVKYAEMILQTDPNNSFALEIISKAK